MDSQDKTRQLLPVGAQDQVYSESSAVVVQLQHEVERMEATLPLLKYVGGEILSMDHWQELHRETTIKWFTFGKVLGASDLMVQKAQDLKVRRRCPFS